MKMIDRKILTIRPNVQHYYNFLLYDLDNNRYVHVVTQNLHLHQRGTDAKAHIVDLQNEHTATNFLVSELMNLCSDR